MKLLIINLDKSIFRPNSLSVENLKDYSRFFDKLFVIAWTRGEEKPIFSEDRLFIYPTNSRSRLFYIFDTYRIFKKFIRNEGIDMVSSQDPFETGLAAYLISRIFSVKGAAPDIAFGEVKGGRGSASGGKIRLHLQSHTDFLGSYFWKESFLNKIRVLLAKFLIPRADCIRVVSERIRKSLVRVTPASPSEVGRARYPLRVAVLPIYVDVKKIREAPVNVNLHKKYSQFDFIILMASRLTREKNIGLAIEAMAEVVKKYPKTGLVIAGSGSEREALKLQITNYKLQKNIIIEDWTDDLASYYKTADLFLLTSNYEGYGMAVVEAMAVGLAVIMTDVGLANEVLIDKKDGIVIPVGNKEKLTEAILNLIENQSLRTRLIENSQKTLDFWPDRNQYLRAYRESWLICC